MAGVGSEETGFPSLLARARGLLEADGRHLLGLAGPPGAGKSTLARRLVGRLGSQAAYVPLDGFHLADQALARLGLGDRKGAPETFDGWGYVALLGRLRAASDPVVYAPSFERSLEQPLAGAIGIDAGAGLVVTEGNYLLLPGPPWDRVRPLLDEAWYCEADEAVLMQRLRARHARFGKTPAEAAAWVERVDRPNIRLVAATKERADLVVVG